MRILNSLCIVAAAMAVVACHPEKISLPPPPVLDGTYVLQTVAGQKVPFITPDGSQGINGSTMSVNANGTYSFTLSVRDAGQNQTLSAQGTYVRNGNSITFKESGDELMTMTWNGSNQLTWMWEEIPFVYEK